MRSFKAKLLGMGLSGVWALASVGTVRATAAATPFQVRVLAEGDKKAEEPKGDPVAVDKLPKKVVDAVKKSLPGARIVKAYVLKDGNYFLDDVKVGKREWDVTVTPQGEILKKEEMKDND